MGWVGLDWVMLVRLGLFWFGRVFSGRAVPFGVRLGRVLSSVGFRVGFGCVGLFGFGCLVWVGLVGFGLVGFGWVWFWLVLVGLESWVGLGCVGL